MKLGQWIGLLALIVSLYILWQSWQMLLLLFTAVVLATALNQLVQQFQSLRIKRNYAVSLSIGILIALLIGFFWLVVPPFTEQFQELVALLPIWLAGIQDWFNLLEERILGWCPDLPDANSFIQQIQPQAEQLLRRFIDFFFVPINAILQLGLVLVLTLVLLLNPQPYEKHLYSYFPLYTADELTKFSYVVGLLIALPLTVVAKIWLEEVLLKDILDKWHHHPSSKLS